ncbi:MAG: PD-(D/E)XK nuclease family protein, partial [Anaerolineae bacterium]|nr:PD-(D/E)XK nuclease family protein [Anaerolineae bacterium]
SPVDIDVADMQHTEVRREWRHIDILVHDPDNKLVCLIENKIYSGEHSNQLERYYNIVRREFPTCRLIPILLSPGGEEPTHEDFIATSYDTIVKVLENVCATYRSVIGPEVSTLITHYITMLRRHIVSDSEIAKLCQKIYRQHQQALDLILEHRPDLQSDIAEYLAMFVERDFSQHQLSFFGTSGKQYFHFHAQEWERLPEALQDAPIEYDDLPLLFQFQNELNQLTLRLCIPSSYIYDPPYPEPICQRLLDTAQTHPEVFRQPDRRIMKRWTWMHRAEFLSAGDYDGADMESLTEKIDSKWQKFLAQDLPKIRAQIDQIDWSGLKFS